MIEVDAAFPNPCDPRAWPGSRRLAGGLRWVVGLLGPGAVLLGGLALLAWWERPGPFDSWGPWAWFEQVDVVCRPLPASLDPLVEAVVLVGFLVTFGVLRRVATPLARDLARTRARLRLHGFWLNHGRALRAALPAGSRPRRLAWARAPGETFPWLLDDGALAVLGTGLWVGLGIGVAGIRYPMLAGRLLGWVVLGVGIAAGVLAWNRAAHRRAGFDEARLGTEDGEVRVRRTPGGDARVVPPGPSALAEGRAGGRPWVAGTALGLALVGLVVGAIGGVRGVLVRDAARYPWCGRHPVDVLAVADRLVAEDPRNEEAVRTRMWENLRRARTEAAAADRARFEELRRVLVWLGGGFRIGGSPLGRPGADSFEELLAAQRAIRGRAAAGWEPAGPALARFRSAVIRGAPSNVDTSWSWTEPEELHRELQALVFEFPGEPGPRLLAFDLVFRRADLMEAFARSRAYPGEPEDPGVEGVLFGILRRVREAHRDLEPLAADPRWRDYVAGTAEVYPREFRRRLLSRIAELHARSGPGARRTLEILRPLLVAMGRARFPREELHAVHGTPLVDPTRVPARSEDLLRFQPCFDPDLADELLTPPVDWAALAGMDHAGRREFLREAGLEEDELWEVSWSDREELRRQGILPPSP